MEIIPLRIWNDESSNGKRLVEPSQQPALREMLQLRGIKLRRAPDQDSFSVQKIASNSRVIIVEGISGSGKDTFQTYLKNKLKNRDVYDYSEGEVLHSWKHLQIEGIFELRVKFMKRFVNHVRDIVSRDDNAVFLLNRFHLSTYASTIIQQPKLEREYNAIVNVLRKLPVHIFILQLDENEIEKRSLHPERSRAWHKFQQQVVEKDGFRGRLEKQQRIILEAANRQQIPYSLIKVSCEPEIGLGQVRSSEDPTIVRRDMRTHVVDAKISRRKRHISPTL